MEEILVLTVLFYMSWQYFSYRRVFWQSELASPLWENFRVSSYLGWSLDGSLGESLDEYLRVFEQTPGRIYVGEYLDLSLCEHLGQYLSEFLGESLIVRTNLDMNIQVHPSCHGYEQMNQTTSSTSIVHCIFAAQSTKLKTQLVLENLLLSPHSIDPKLTRILLCFRRCSGARGRGRSRGKKYTR